MDVSDIVCIIDLKKDYTHVTNAYSILRLIQSHRDQGILTRLSEIKVLARLTGVNEHYLYGSVFCQVTRFTGGSIKRVYCI